MLHEKTAEPRDDAQSGSLNIDHRVSVVIPAYNASQYIAMAIDSVLDQTLKVDEIIVIDDGSTDRTREVVAKYEAKGVRYVHQHNQGSACARNKGVELASGRYIAFLDADDFWLPNKINLQVRTFKENPGLALVSGDQIFWDQDKSFNKVREFSRRQWDSDSTKQIIFENIVGNPSMVMVKRSVLQQAGLFDAKIRFGDDWDMWMRVSEIGKIGFVQEPISVYRWHKNSISQSHQRACLASYRMICRRGIRRSITPIGRPIAYLKLVRHSDSFYYFRTIRRQTISMLRRIFPKIASHDQRAL